MKYIKTYEEKIMIELEIPDGFLDDVKELIEDKYSNFVEDVLDIAKKIINLKFDGSREQGGANFTEYIDVWDYEDEINDFLANKYNMTNLELGLL